MQKITPFLWFDDNAEEAVNLYVTTFANSRVLAVSRYPESVPERGGKVMVISFELEGQAFTALNGGPQYRFTEAISLAVNCESQREVDMLWARLTENGGAPGRCGWLKDRFGLSWQIIPTALSRMMSDPDPVKAGRVTQAMMAMGKIDLAGLLRAYQG